VDQTTRIAPGKGTSLLFNFNAELGSLQEYSCSVNLDRDSYLLVELPGPAVRGPETEALRIGTRGDLSVRFVTEALPKWRHGPETILNFGQTKYDGFIDDALTRMQEARDFFVEIAGRNPSGHVYWTHFLDEFIEYRDEDEAARGLIVKIAEKMPSYLRDIAFGPKRILRRLREESRLDRIQELDVHCLLDFAQRPGRTAVEKAGQKQRLLAVKRQETLDTLENRVALDFCRRCVLAIRSFQDQNEHVLPYDEDDQPKGSKRLAQVMKYGKYCHAYLQDPVWAEVSTLLEPCRTPNYALAQNPLYVEVWREYLKLLRYANLRETVWRWPRKTWSDVARMIAFEGTRSALDGMESVKLSDPPVRIASTIEKGCWYRQAECGCGWLIRNDGVDVGCLYFLDRVEISSFSQCDELAMANADFYLAWLPRDSRAVFYLPIWAVVGDIRWKDPEYAARTREAWIDDLSRSLEVLRNMMPAPSRLSGGLAIRADWMCERPGVTKMVQTPDGSTDLPVWFLESHAHGGWKDQPSVIHQVVNRLVHNASRN
jgi:hypothetical protein